MASEQQTTDRVSGRVKWFDNRKGFGFINNLSNGNEMFVHHSGLNSSNGVFRTLYPGEYVEFSVRHDSQTNRDCAVDVTGIQGGPLFCENTSIRLMLRRSKPTSEKSSSQKNADGYQTVQRKGKKSSE